MLDVDSVIAEPMQPIFGNLVSKQHVIPIPAAIVIGARKELFGLLEIAGISGGRRAQSPAARSPPVFLSNVDRMPGSCPI